MQRISRSQLLSRSTTPSSAAISRDDSGNQIDLTQRLNALVATQVPTPICQPSDELRSDEAAPISELEFRLFNHDNPHQAPIKIRLDSPERTSANAGLVRAARPLSEYLRGPWSQRELHRFEAAAIDSQAICKLGRISWKGCTLSWRVSHTQILSEPSHHASVLSLENIDRIKSAKPSKQTRIRRRKRLTLLQERKGLEAEKAAEQDLLQKAKRTQRNRDRKVKKKQRAKRKKSANTG